MHESFRRNFIRWMEDNRGLILTVIGLPASFMFDVVLQVNMSEMYEGNSEVKGKKLVLEPENVRAFQCGKTV